MKEILENFLLEDVLDKEGVDYRIGHGSSGEQLNIKECPFCNGSEWKVYANRDSGLGNCFHGSCGTTFNVFTFTAAQIAGDNRRTAQYLERMADEMGWRPKRSTHTATEIEENKDWKLPDNFDLPTKDGQTLKYLKDRRVDNETTKYFNLKYCPDGWFNYIKSDGAKGGMYFGERVLIPIYDLDGTMVTFQGRDLTGDSDRKYLFPPGLPGTGRFIYNGQNAAGKRSVIMCEGAFDVIRTWVNIKGTKHEDKAVVGSFGIHLSRGADGADQKNKLLLLKSWGTKEVIVFWDGEDAAYKKALKSSVEIMKMGFKVKIARPPVDKDPGELTVEETVKALNDAISLTQMVILKLRLG
tara:strand:- start:10120 stop:11181 length:1062 start_codon:yes stop_codon:yes gene_type:complete